MTIINSDMIVDRFKVIWTDGFARETSAEHAVVEHLNKELADRVCETLRDQSAWEGNWWIVVPQDKRLWRGMAEFV